MTATDYDALVLDEATGAIQDRNEEVSPLSMFKQISSDFNHDSAETASGRPGMVPFQLKAMLKIVTENPNVLDY